MSGAISSELHGWIGRQVTYEAPEELGRAACRYFALALDDDNPLYRDEAIAGSSVHGGVVAPPTLVCETNQFYRQPPDEAGYIGHAWDLPLPGRFMRGGNEYEFHQPVRPDDRVTVTWTLLDIQRRETRSSGSTVFVVSEARYVNQRGELLAVNRETTVYAP